MPLPLSEQLAFNTVRIECDLQSGFTGTGTGFFYQVRIDHQTNIPVLVTNKHVVEGAHTGRFYLNFTHNIDHVVGDHEMFSITNFDSHWIKHPDPLVDLCVMPIGEIVMEIAGTGRKIFYTVVDKSIILSPEAKQNITALEDIIMIGYPNGIWDSVNNKPIIRRGITATDPKMPYEGRQEFLIDAACFPGSSGSPVYLFNEGSYSDGHGVVLGSRIYLLGILYAGPQQTSEGEIEIVNIPTHQKPIAVSRIPINLGLVINAERLLDFEPILLALA